ncbi:MAG: glycosyltransferase [Candidatus Nanopelagicaceae bacterium]
MADSCEIAIIIPVFNEQDTIARVLTDVNRSLVEPAIVYLIADSSSDPTIPAAELAAKGIATPVRMIIQDGARGPASAIKLGIESSNEKFVVFMTADDSDDARDIPRLISSLRAGASVVCASRYARGGQHIGGPRLKYFLSWLAGRIVRYIKRLKTCDPTNLFKAVTRDFLDNISIESKFGFTLGLELVGKANIAEYPIAEIPTIWHERTVGASSFKTLKWLPTYIYWFLRLIFSK